MKKNLFFSLILGFALSGCGPGLRNFDPSGNSSDGVLTAENVLHIYSTSGWVTGNLGGVESADTICNMDSNKPSGTYKALLANGTTRVACTTANCGGRGVAEHVGWVLQPNKSYVRADGTLIGKTNGAGLFVMPLASPIDPKMKTVWTGLNGNWTISSNCSGWTSESGSGRLGNANGTDETVLSDGGDKCSSTNVLYCVEQPTARLFDRR